MQELDSLLQAVRIFSSDIGMQFEIIKYAVLELKWGKVMQSGEIQLRNGQKIKSLEGEKIYKKWLYKTLTYYQQNKGKLRKKAWEWKMVVEKRNLQNVI